MTFVKDWDTAVLQATPSDVITLRDVCAGGVHVFSRSGGGKTTGPGRLLAGGAILRTGAGALITTSKPEDIELWRDYAQEHGRADSLIVFDEHEGFNFLNYLLALHGMAGIGAVTECLMKVIESARRATGSAGRGEDSFWTDQSRQGLRYAIPPLYAAYGTLSVADIIRFIVSAPKNRKEPEDAEWQKHSFMYKTMAKTINAPAIPMPVDALKNCIAYWADEFAATPDRTLGNIVATITTALDRFRHGRLNTIFCGNTTVVPELTFHGALIVLAMPTLTWNEDGVIAQQLFRFLWQRAVVGRNKLPPKHRERFVFCWSDEAQELADSDATADFLSVCRGSRCGVIHLTQSLPSYYAKMGRDDAHALVGKFNTHLYGSCACPETNEFAARTIGKVLKRHRNYNRGMSHTKSFGSSHGGSESSSWSRGSSTSSSSGANGGSSSASTSTSYSRTDGSNWSENRGASHGESESDGYSESMEYLIEPGEFARGGFKTGGPEHDYEVNAVWLQAGRVFQESGTNVFFGRFKQR